MNGKIPDIPSEPRMVHEPVIKTPVATQKQRSCQKQKRRRRQHGQEYTENA